MDPKLLDAPDTLTSLEFTITNRCGLRCTYCPQGTHEDSFYADVNDEVFARILSIIRNKHVQRASIGYYGEMLLVEHWWQYARQIMDAGCVLRGTTGFPRVITQEEADTFSRFGSLEISIDTHDIERLKSMRRKVDARTIVYDTHLVRASALANGRPVPQLIWTGVLNDQVVKDLPAFITFAASNGIKFVNFNDMMYFDGTVAMQSDGPRKVFDLEGEEFLAAGRQITLAFRLAQRHGIQLSWAGLVTFKAKLESLSTGRPLVKRVEGLVGIQGTYSVDLMTKTPLQPGTTRACFAPWTWIYLDPKGDVYTCCVRGNIMGRIDHTTTVDDVLNGPAYRELRRALLTGEGLDRTCTFCPMAQVIPVEAFTEQVRGRLGLPCAEPTDAPLPEQERIGKVASGWR